jgi:hypothetical protein
MNNPFLQNFLKARAAAAAAAPLPILTHVGGASKTPSMSAPGEGVRTAKGLAATNPNGKAVEEWFKNRIQQLDAEYEAKEDESKVR